MADLKIWQGYVSQCQGEMVAWINQTLALKGTDSDGVCNAVTLEWIEGLGAVQTRAAFYNKFVKVNEKGEFLDYSLPKEYIDRQKELQAKYILNVETLAKMLEATQEYKRKNPNNVKEYDEMYENYFKIEPTVRGGDQCKSVVTCESVEEFIKFFSTFEQQSYAFTLHMMAGSSGHAVAFNLQPIQGSGPENFVYHFLDPNTGWFYFKEFRMFFTFITKAVLGNYKVKYKTYKINEYRVP